VIIIKIFLKYLKNISIFIFLELFISFVLGFFNLIGLNTSISSIVLFILNATIFTIFGFINGLSTNKKGMLEGLITGLYNCLVLLIFSLIIFKSSITAWTFIYYLILISFAIIGATFGKNKKSESTSENKK